ncbi:MAG TPA: histidinol dehydrogenase [Clostridiales bacterium]|nr:histidinol dehydrogenase [Clostridiales bacterium]
MIEIIDCYAQGKDVLLEKIQNRSRLESEDIGAKVEEILENVKQLGDEALFQYTLEFDGVELNAGNIKVTRDEIERAYDRVDDYLIEVMKEAALNIKQYHEKQLEKSWIDTKDNGTFLGQLYRPMERVGVYVPGGRAAYPSSVLMNVIPAKVAGVKDIVMVSPPSQEGEVYSNALVAANEAGVTEIYKIGGAQAIAALAFGTQTIKKVDKIVGPGNIYVASAKRRVFGYVDIDMIAGPSEVLVLADESANPKYIAADLLSQAEHDPMASAILVTNSYQVAEKVKEQLISQSEVLSTKTVIKESLKEYGAIIVVRDMAEAVEIANIIAPEHLEIMVDRPMEMLGKIKNAGAIFLGGYSPEPLGDYFAGPNHVLPTGGTARFFSPLSVDDFIKKSSIIYYNKGALKKVGPKIIAFAKSEGLTAHAASVKVRLDDDE